MTLVLNEPDRFPALGTTAAVAVTDPDARADARALLEAELAAIDLACSRFRDDSELSTVNHSSGRAVSVSRLFLDALDAALRAAELTDGRVDPTVGGSMKVLGYDRDFSAIVPDGPALRIRVRAVPGWKCITRSHRARTVRVPEGVVLDLGATAKALAADRAATRIATATGAGVLVSLGGDCAIAGPAPEAGWLIRIADRHDAPADGPGPAVVLHAGAVATSGTTARRWARGGRPLHHVLDPATGEPAPEVWQTATVAAANCVDANTASTAAIVLGEDAPDWLASHGLPARLVRPGGHVTRVGTWPDA